MRQCLSPSESRPARREAPELRQPLALELDGEARLLRLALPRDLVADVEVPDELLGQRGAALDDLAALDVLHGGAQNPLVVDAAVRVEAPVLDRHGRLREEGRHLVEGDRLAVLLRRDGAEHGAVRRVDEGVLPDGHGPERRERAAVLERLDARERGRDEDRRAAQEEREEEDEDEPARLGPVAAAALAAPAPGAVVGRPGPAVVPVAAATSVPAVPPVAVPGHE